MSGEFALRKQKLIELARVSSVKKENIPEKDCSIRSISGNKKELFIFTGLLNNKFCSFKLDTGSDVSLVSYRVVSRASAKDFGLNVMAIDREAESKVSNKGKSSCQL